MYIQQFVELLELALAKSNVSVIITPPLVWIFSVASPRKDLPPDANDAMSHYGLHV